MTATASTWESREDQVTEGQHALVHPLTSTTAHRISHRRRRRGAGADPGLEPEREQKETEITPLKIRLANLETLFAELISKGN